MGIEDILQQGPAVALNEEDDKLRTQIRANRLQRAKQMAAHFQQVVDGSLNTENLKLSAELGDNSINSDGRGDILAEPVTVQKSIVYNSSSESHCSEETFCHRHSRLKNQRHHGKKRKRRRFCSSKKGSPSRSSDSSSGSHRKSFSRSRSRSASPNYLRRRTRQRECRGDSSCSSVSSPVLVADTVRPLLTLQQKIAQALAKENLSLL